MVDHPDSLVLALLLADIGNQVDAASCNCTRVCKETTSAVLVTCTKKSRGDSRKGVEVRPTSDANPTFRLLHALSPLTQLDKPLALCNTEYH